MDWSHVECCCCCCQLVIALHFQFKCDECCIWSKVDLKFSPHKTCMTASLVLWNILKFVSVNQQCCNICFFLFWSVDLLCICFWMLGFTLSVSFLCVTIILIFCRTFPIEHIIFIHQWTVERMQCNIQSDAITLCNACHWHSRGLCLQRMFYGSRICRLWNVFTGKYTSWVKKWRHSTVVHDFAKCWPIFKILSRADPSVNL